MLPAFSYASIKRCALFSATPLVIAADDEKFNAPGKFKFRESDGFQSDECSWCSDQNFLICSDFGAWERAESLSLKK